jgi:hypothetical protein
MVFGPWRLNDVVPSVECSATALVGIVETTSAATMARPKRAANARIGFTTLPPF